MVPKYDTNEAWRTMARWKSALNLISSFRETAIIHLTEGFRHVFKPCVHTLTDNERKHFRTLEKKVTQSCLTLCDPMDYTVHGILQARILERVAVPFSRRYSQPRDWTQASHIGWILYQLSHKGSPTILEWVVHPFSSRSSQPRNWTGVSCTAGRFFTNWAIREAHYLGKPLENRSF